MKTVRCLFIALMLALVPLERAAAQDWAAEAFRKDFLRLNETPPADNRDLHPLADFIGRHIRDDSGRAIGAVEDIQVDAGGSRQFIQARLETGLNRASALIDLRKVKTVETGGDYLLPYHRNALKDLSAETLAGIEPAAGETSGFLNARTFPGLPLFGEDGKRLGEIETVLFSDGGYQAVALAVSHIPGAPRGRTVAVPFGRFLNIADEGNGKRVILARPCAAVLMEEAKQIDKRR